MGRALGLAKSPAAAELTWEFPKSPQWSLHSQSSNAPFGQRATGQSPGTRPVRGSGVQWGEMGEDGNRVGSARSGEGGRGHPTTAPRSSKPEPARAQLTHPALASHSCPWGLVFPLTCWLPMPSPRPMGLGTLGPESWRAGPHGAAQGGQPLPAEGAAACSGPRRPPRAQGARQDPPPHSQQQAHTGRLPSSALLRAWGLWSPRSYGWASAWRGSSLGPGGSQGWGLHNLQRDRGRGRGRLRSEAGWGDPS